MVDRQLRQRMDDGKGEALRQRHRLAARQRVLTCNERAEAEPFQRDLPQVGRMPERDGDADIGLAPAQGFEQVGRSHHLGGEADAPGTGPVRGDQIRQHRPLARGGQGESGGFTGR